MGLDLCNSGHMGGNFRVWVSPGDRSRLERLVSDRKTPQKHVWRVRIVPLSGDGHGTMEIMRQVGTMTHDYEPTGATTLFAALNVLDGTVIGQCTERRGHLEFLGFLRTFTRETPKALDPHLIVDNQATHKHAKVKE